MSTYGLLVLLACTLGEILTLASAVRCRMGWRSGALMCVNATVLCLLSARFFYILVCDLTGAGLFGELFPQEPYFYAFGGGVLGYVLALALTAKLTRCSLAQAGTVYVPSGLAVVAALRMAEALSDFGWGDWVEFALLQRYPFAVANMYGEWCAAVFNLEALAALGILAFVLRRRERALPLALIWWSASQIFCESLRIESIQWGFVRVQQLLGAVIIAAVMLAYSRHASRRRLLISWIGFASCVGLVVFLEYAIDKMPWPTFLNYVAMALAVVGMGACAQGLTVGRQGV